MKFEELSELLQESPRFLLNAKGQLLLQKYQDFIRELEQWIEKDAVISILSNIDATNRATKEFKLAKKLSILTNDGRSDIDGSQYMINPEDELMYYLVQR